VRNQASRLQHGAYDRYLLMLVVFRYSTLPGRATVPSKQSQFPCNLVYHFCRAYPYVVVGTLAFYFHLPMIPSTVRDPAAICVLPLQSYQLSTYHAVVKIHRLRVLY
jgi:hypothetical protein